MRKETREAIEKCIEKSTSFCYSLIASEEAELKSRKNHLEETKKRKPSKKFSQEDLNRIIAYKERKIVEQQEIIDELLRFKSITSKEQFFRRIKSSLDKSNRDEMSFRNFLAHDLLIYGLATEVSIYFCLNLWFLSEEV